jgi:hypothetical protein
MPTDTPRPDLDMNEAIEAAAQALLDWQEDDPFSADSARTVATTMLIAAAPILERQVREKIAREIDNAQSHPEHEPTCQSCITESVYRQRHAAIALRGFS